METAIMTLGKQQIMTIRADARQGSAHVERSCIIHQFLLSETQVFGLKRFAIEVILYLRICGANVLVAHLLGQWHRLAVVEVSAIGRPRWIDLQEFRIVTDHYHRVRFYVIEYHVALKVIDLNLVGISRMECLTGQIGREGNQLLCWMPRRIDTRRNGIVTLEIDFRHLAIVDQHRAAVRQTHMEEHIVGLVVLIAVAVDTLSFLAIVAGDGIVEYLVLVEVGDIALGNRHIAPCHIGRFDETIRDILVDRICSNIQFKRTEREPLTLFLAPYFYLDRLSLRALNHILPLVFWNQHLDTLAIGLLLAIGSREPSHTCTILSRWKHEIERSDIIWNGDIAIVRIDGWQTISLLAFRRYIGMTYTRRQQKQGNCQYLTTREDVSFHIVLK